MEWKLSNAHKYWSRCPVSALILCTDRWNASIYWSSFAEIKSFSGNSPAYKIHSSVWFENRLHFTICQMYTHTNGVWKGKQADVCARARSRANNRSIDKYYKYIVFHYLCGKCTIFAFFYLCTMMYRHVYFINTAHTIKYHTKIWGSRRNIKYYCTLLFGRFGCKASQDQFLFQSRKKWSKICENRFGIEKNRCFDRKF